MSILSEVERLEQAKEDIRNAIMEKGVSVDGDESLSKYDTYIASIEGGGGDEGDGGTGFPPGDCTDISVSIKNKELWICWKDPENREDADAPISIWGGTRLVRKIGSYPAHINDGTVLVNNTTRNIYSKNAFVDTGLTNDTVYYYALFPYNTTGKFNVSENNRISGTPKAVQIFGASISMSNTNPKTAVTYTDDASAFTPMQMTAQGFNWGSWQDIFLELGIKPCMFSQGEVLYWLDPNDFTKKEDGTPADIENRNVGDVMIQFPKIYWNIWKDANNLHIKWSTKPFEGAICPAFKKGAQEKDFLYIGAYDGEIYSSKLRSVSGKTPAYGISSLSSLRTNANKNGSGYHLLSYYAVLLLQVLFVTFFKDRDSGAALGLGRVNKAGYSTSGSTNDKGMFYGSTDDTQGVKFCGLENLWGNIKTRIDGIYVSPSFDLHISDQSYFQDDMIVFPNHGKIATQNISGFIRNVLGGNHTGFIPHEVGGSSTTYYCDSGMVSGDSYLAFGGDNTTRTNSGIFQMEINFQNSSYEGARLMYL